MYVYDVILSSEQIQRRAGYRGLLFRWSGASLRFLPIRFPCLDCSSFTWLLSSPRSRPCSPAAPSACFLSWFTCCSFQSRPDNLTRFRLIHGPCTPAPWHPCPVGPKAPRSVVPAARTLPVSTEHLHSGECHSSLSGRAGWVESAMMEGLGGASGCRGATNA